MTSPPRSVVEWIRSAAIPIAGVEPRRGSADLQALRAIVGDARILSLGEATHGTREFFQLKHRIVEFCVAELGFTTFILEASFPESLAVNAYVLHGAGTAADALAGMRFWIWDTEEVLDLIEWLRWWNQRHPRQVTFYGYAMAYPPVAVQGLVDFLARVAPDLAATCRAELAPLTSDLTAELFGQLPEARRRAVPDCIAQVLAAFDRERSEWVAATSELDWHLGRLHAVVVDQGARLELDRNSDFHERAVAENVCALLAAEGPGARAVLWSHNAHAERAVDESGGKSMGQHLDEMVGRAQVAVGFAFDRGSFCARTYPTARLETHSVSAAASESLDGVLAQAGLPLFALDFANAPREGPVAEWLAAPTPMRSIGGIYGLEKRNRYNVTYTESITPRENFDAMVFVAETTAAHNNRPSSAPLSPAMSPRPSNLELAGDGVPAGWWATGAQLRYPYSIRLAEEPSPRGGRTVRMSRAAPWRWGDGRLVQKIDAQAFRGRRLRFSAAVRTATEEAGAGALLLLRFLAKPEGEESDFFIPALATAVSAAHPTSSPQWTTLAVEADVPEEADAIVTGLVMAGNGVAWFGDLEFAAIARAPPAS